MPEARSTRKVRIAHHVFSNKIHRAENEVKHTTSRIPIPRRALSCLKSTWASSILLVLIFFLTGCAACRSWNDVFTRDKDAGYGWISGDGAYTVELPGGRILWLFGDSLVSTPDGNTQLVRNSIAVHSVPLGGGAPAKAAIRFYARNENHRMVDVSCRNNIPPGNLRAWADPAGWLWPKDGAMVGDTLVIFYARVHCTQGEPPGCAGEWDWEKTGTYVMLVDNPEEDVLRWNISLQKTGLGKEKWGCALFYEAPYLYVFGIDENYLGRYAKYRVDGSNVRRFSDWQFLGITDDIAQNLPTEFSVDKVSMNGLARYVMVHQKLFFSYDAVMRMSPSLDRWPDEAAGPHVWAGDLRNFDQASEGDHIWAVKGHAELSEKCPSGRHVLTEPCRRCMLISYYSRQLGRLRFTCFPFAKLDPWRSIRGCAP